MGAWTPTAAGRATLADLARTPGKAELIDGRIVPLMPTGHRPNWIAGEIFFSLKNHTRATGRGVAYTDNMGFAVTRLASGRESFSPDVSYYDGPLPADDMDFVAGSPTFAVEVRSKTDSGSAAVAAMAAKRTDYFQAGTAVVWDVDPRARCLHIYRADTPDRPVTVQAGQVADAEPAVPGWRLAVDDLFP
ncbi:MAG: Uma2 family endonuclease [Isosphaeraceae bacterium]